MRIYTSYFNNPVKLPPDKTLSLAITAFTPKWWSGDTFSVVAPPKELVLYYKGSKNRRDTDLAKLQDFYIEYYVKKVLSTLNPNEVVNALENIANAHNKENIVLLCFEKTNDFCHRHILRSWFNQNGIKCEEVC